MSKTLQVAIIGGTHGNEPVGIEVMKAFQKNKPKECLHQYKTFFANPKAYELKTRFVHTDLNRAFGKNGIRKGYEAGRVHELESGIRNQFDLTLDLHTSTSNMGLTLILNNTHDLSRNVAAYLKRVVSGLKIIEEDQLDEESTHLNRLAPAGLTIEVGPVANNVVSAYLLQQTYNLVLHILQWDVKKEDLGHVEYFKMGKVVFFPPESGWYIHPDVDNRDFQALKPGAPLFINLKGETLAYDGGREVYPFFINEAAYIPKGYAMILSSKEKGLGN